MEQEASLLLLALLFLGQVQCAPHEYSNYFDNLIQRNHKSSPIQICGTHLATAISIVCNGRYNTLHHLHKRRNVDEVELRFPFKRREEAKSMLRHNRRRRQGVTDECCKKACTFDELRTFCAPTSS